MEQTTDSIRGHTYLEIADRALLRALKRRVSTVVLRQDEVLSNILYLKYKYGGPRKNAYWNIAVSVADDAPYELVVDQLDTMADQLLDKFLKAYKPRKKDARPT